MTNPPDRRVGSSLAIFGWLTGSCFFFYAWVLRVAPSVMISELMRDFSIGAATIGSLSAFYFYGYAGMQIPVGMMIDRFGPRRLMIAAGLMCAGGCVLFAYSPAMAGLAAGRFIVGASAAFSLVGAMAVAAQWFPPARFAVLSGFAMMFGMAGGVFGQAPLRLLVESVGWREAAACLALGGVLISAAAWLSVRDGRRGSGGFAGVVAGLAVVVRNRQTWLISLAGLGTTAPLLGFAGLWGVPYLETIHGLARAEAAAITSMLFVGWGAGAPVFGWLSDRIGRRRLPFLSGLVICTLSIAALVFLPSMNWSVLAALCFLCGFGGSSQIVGFAAVREHNPIAFGGTAIGIVNCAVTGAGALYQPLLGWLLDVAWDGASIDGARVYGAAAFRFAFTAVVAGSALGILCAALIRETWCRQQT